MFDVPKDSTQNLYVDSLCDYCERHCVYVNQPAANVMYKQQMQWKPTHAA